MAPYYAHDDDADADTRAYDATGDMIADYALLRR